ncbi:MAG: AraC family transcriptional regulator [Flavobacterium sp.]|nr:MAG: AraC family transcriptional regulator [Flavobacterium sp.]
MQFSIIQYLLTCVAVISVINIILILKLNAGTTFSYVLRYFNSYLFVHALFVLSVEQFYGHLTWLERYAPFSLMYGPFLYFAFSAVSNKNISIQRVIAHSLPFILSMIVFLYIIMVKPNNFMFAFYKTLNFSTVISFCAYTLLVMFLNTAPLNDQFRPRKLVVLGAIIMLLFVSIIAIVALTSTQQIVAKPNAVLLLRTMIYSCMLISAVMVFKYKINTIFLKVNTIPVLDNAEEDSLQPISYRVAKYEKSNLSDKQLDEYSKKLEKLMLSQRVYLTTDLSLQKLAQSLRIPNHHLTQVLSIKIKMGFYDYVNGFRVQYACMLLETEPSVNLENIAERSGFNSKVSFNRHFKALLGRTPSEYRAEHKDPTESKN